MDRTFPMTLAGFALLPEELKRLRQVDRTRVVAMIAEARALGDLADNAAYQAAREEQGRGESRIAEAEDLADDAIVIDPSKLSGSAITFGATVTIVDEGSGEETTTQIASSYEAAKRPGCLAHTSRGAWLLIGKGVGDRVEIAAPDTRAVHRVTAVRFVR